MQRIRTRLIRVESTHYGNMSNLIYLPDLIKQAKPLFFKLLEKADNLEHKYLNYYGDDDIRAEVFERQVQLNVWALIGFDDFLEVMKDTNGKVTRYIQLAQQGRAIFI